MMKCKKGNVFAYLFLVAILVMQLILCTPILPGTIAESKPDLTTAFEENKGETPSNPYLITSIADFNTLARWVNSGGKTSYYYKLTTNLDFEKSGGGKGSFTMIGTDTNHFMGNFDGDGHIIRNFALTGSGTDLGVFAYSNGIIENLKIDSGSITLSTSGLSAGGFVGSMYGGAQIINCANLGVTVTTSSSAGGSSIGGILGCCGTTATGATISQCYNLADITNNGSGSGTARAGGIAGEANVPISECFNMGNIQSGNDSSTESSYAGGIAGTNGGSISDCYSRGSVIAYAKTTNTKVSSPTYSVIAEANLGTVYDGSTKKTFPNAEGCKKGDKCSEGNQAHPMFNVASDCVLSKIKLFKSDSPAIIGECNAYAGGLSFTGNITRSYCVTDSNRAIEIKGGYRIEYISFYYELYNNKSAEAIYKKELGETFGYYPSKIESYASNNNNSSNKVMSNVSPQYVSGPSTSPSKGADIEKTEYWPRSSWTGYAKGGSETWTHKNWLVTVDWALMCKITASAEAGKELRIQPVVSFARHCKDGPKDGYSGSWAEAPADTRVEPGALTASLSYSEPSVSTNNVDANALGGAFAESDIINGGYPHLKCFYWQDNMADFV